MKQHVLMIGTKQFVVKPIGTHAQSASGRVRGNQILIRIPVHWPREEAFKAFLDLRKKMIESIQKNPAVSQRPKVQFTDGQHVSVMGLPFQIDSHSGKSRVSKARVVGNMVQIELAEGLDGEKRAEHISNLARRVISRNVLPKVEQRVRGLNETHFNFPIRRVFLKETSSRWGSCSENANINLNFALLFGPPDVLDYVIVHELAHLKEQNHSSAFWGLVSSAMPDYGEKRKWLRENGHSLGVSAAQSQDAD